MAETSKARVTITLGRSGQVVKRAATSSDDGYSNSLHGGAGTKRSVMDRLGSNSDISSSSDRNKRQRGDGSLISLGSNGVEDVRVGKDDLRYKLMRKNVFRRAEIDDDQKPIDLREKLSRTTRPPPGPPPRPPPPSSFDSQQRRPPETKEANMLTRMPPTRSADDLQQMDSSRNSYSAWTLDHIRRRSPERVISTSRGLSPPRSMEDLQRRPVNRMYDVRTVPYMNNDVFDTPRSVTSSSTAFMGKPALPPPIVSAKPVAPAPLMGQLPPPSGIVPKTSYVVEEPQTVDGLLNSLGLGKYAILFKAEEVDMTALKQMGETDLKELGIPMGPRKKILLALLPRSKRHP